MLGSKDAVPLSRLDLMGSLGLAFASVAVSSNTSFNEVFIFVTDTTAARTITLRTADTVARRVYVIIDVSGGAAANNITIATEGSQTISGQPDIKIAADFGALSVISDGSNWFAWGTT